MKKITNKHQIHKISMSGAKLNNSPKITSRITYKRTRACIITRVDGLKTNFLKVNRNS